MIYKYTEQLPANSWIPGVFKTRIWYEFSKVQGIWETVYFCIWLQYNPSIREKAARVIHSCTFCSLDTECSIGKIKLLLNLVETWPRILDLTFGDCWFTSLHIIPGPCTQNEQSREQTGDKDKRAVSDKIGRAGVSRGDQTETPALHRRGSVAGGLYLRGFAAPGTLAMQTAKRTAASQHPVTHREAKVERRDTIWDNGRSKQGEGMKRSAM